MELTTLQHFIRLINANCSLDSGLLLLDAEVLVSLLFDMRKPWV